MLLFIAGVLVAILGALTMTVIPILGLALIGIGGVIVLLSLFGLLGWILETLFSPAMGVREKDCPACAEKVKAAAKVCRFCGHDFTPATPPPAA